MRDLPTKFAELKTLVEEIARALEYRAPDACLLPAQYAGNVRGLEINPSSYGRKIDAETKRAIDTVREMAMTVETQRGLEDKQRILFEIARRIEAVRSYLPSLAASVSIELGIVARNLMDQGDPI